MAAKTVMLTAFVRHDGIQYGPGNRIELSAADAERLVRLGVAVIEETVAEVSGDETGAAADVKEKPVRSGGNKRRR